MRATILLLIGTALATGCSDKPKPAYGAELSAGITSSCVKSGGQLDFCTCVTREMARLIPEEEARAADIQARMGGGVSDNIAKAVALATMACGPKKSEGTVAPSASRVNVDQGLPTCQQAETLRLVEQVINNLPAARASNASFVSLKDIGEQGFNRDSEIRACGAILVTTAGEDRLQYSINWQNKGSKQFVVTAQIVSADPATLANTMQEISNQVATDAVDQYQIAKRTSDSPMDWCVSAGLVTAGYLQAKDERNYAKWKVIEKADCARAGLQK